MSLIKRLVLIFFACAAALPVFLFSGGSASGRDSGEAGIPVVTDFSLPEFLSLCGERLPLERRSVREMLDREFTMAVWDRAQVFMWLKRSGRYFPYIEKRLAEEGMPQDLKYLAVAESALITHIRSPRGAMGPWQFMPRTGREIGLRKNNRLDERKDFEKATDAALSYLKELHSKFGSWTLAMAAYNCGDRRLGDEIKLQRVKDFYRLNLPLETERYIFRIASIKLIMENPSRYGYHLPEDRIYRPLSCERHEVNPEAMIPIVDLAEALDTDFKTIKELNPHILGEYLPAGRYKLRVPAGCGPRLTEMINRLSTKIAKTGGAITGEVYVVRPGDTLIHISRRSGTPVDTIRRLNNLQGSLIRVGQRLRLSP
ncbi:MAG: transglycosylase SLT domain-containing protein [Desulfobacteraceae bacterium]